MILVIDDDPLLSLILCKHLNKFMDVIVAHDGEDGYFKLLSMKKNGTLHTLNFVLTDLMMPKIDGFGFTRLVKTNIDTKKIPIFGYTSSSSASILVKAKSVGMESVFHKSKSFLELIEEFKARSLL
ncbi:hypothetical protein C0W80_18835 [Photobacterium leiognathi subsp. mandapamensis]|uniref:response regulator n=1 Tax=Photobacterium leiognathi TaxID=553611 RepID=UPI000D179CF7|nr:response regulator [Photobacterium leiognathi]PSU95230.1 hypothetical protein C0W80_18835 [Photobacterium leiognathi subsp. mandapamensis]